MAFCNSEMRKINLARVKVSRPGLDSLGEAQSGLQSFLEPCTVVRPHACNKGLSFVCFSRAPSPGSLPGLHFLLDSLLTSGCPPCVLLEKTQLHFRIQGIKTWGKSPGGC